eukprot:214591-Prorocentrum_minimum.AAC.1
MCIRDRVDSGTEGVDSRDPPSHKDRSGEASRGLHTSLVLAACVLQPTGKADHYEQRLGVSLPLDPKLKLVRAIPGRLPTLPFNILLAGGQEG